MKAKNLKSLQAGALLIVIAFAGYYFWQEFTAETDFAGIASGNGRIEAVEIHISARMPGRIGDIFVQEGQFVERGQALAMMDTETLVAQRHQAEAHLRERQTQVRTAHSQVSLREAEKAAAEALLSQRIAERELAEVRLARSERLVAQQALSQDELDNARAQVRGARAAESAVRAQIAAAEAAITAAISGVASAEEAVAAVLADIERIQADIKDSTLIAPRSGRIQTIVMRPGEVIGAGGRVMNLVDLHDVYMNFFLPTAAVGRLSIGAEARIILDAIPEYVIPAEISFIADVAQFTPRTVETQLERERLMFRVRARIPQTLLERYITQVRTGLPGVAYVRLDSDMAWPDALQVNLPQ